MAVTVTTDATGNRIFRTTDGQLLTEEQFRTKVQNGELSAADSVGVQGVEGEGITMPAPGPDPTAPMSQAADNMATPQSSEATPTAAQQPTGGDQPGSSGSVASQAAQRAFDPNYASAGGVNPFTLGGSQGPAPGSPEDRAARDAARGPAAAGTTTQSYAGGPTSPNDTNQGTRKAGTTSMNEGATQNFGYGPGQGSTSVTGTRGTNVTAYDPKSGRLTFQENSLTDKPRKVMGLFDKTTGRFVIDPTVGPEEATGKYSPQGNGGKQGGWFNDPYVSGSGGTYHFAGVSGINPGDDYEITEALPFEGGGTGNEQTFKGSTLLGLPADAGASPAPGASSAPGAPGGGGGAPSPVQPATGPGSANFSFGNMDPSNASARDENVYALRSTDDPTTWARRVFQQGSADFGPKAMNPYLDQNPLANSPFVRWMQDRYGLSVPTNAMVQAELGGQNPTSSAIRNAMQGMIGTNGMNGPNMAGATHNLQGLNTLLNTFKNRGSMGVGQNLFAGQLMQDPQLASQIITGQLQGATGGWGMPYLNSSLNNLATHYFNDPANQGPQSPNGSFLGQALKMMGMG